MIVQIGFDYDINLSRILYTEMNHDEQHLKVIFDSGIVLELTKAEHINGLQKYFKYNTGDTV
jgi:hypothetical protein